jgi:predicted dehydrogenase
MSIPKRYALVGLGDRARMYTGALLGEYCSAADLVALCDVNESRMRWHNGSFQDASGRPPVPMYGPQDFERLLDEERVDVVIVTSVDRTHARYIVAALEHDCDVITEKPLTVDAGSCQRIVDTVRASGRHVTVAFNYRYAPRNSAVRHVLAAGEIGSVLSVHFEWLLDTKHGADYFRRWHRDKRNSGGLMVHKASHHFDLVNWWLGARPETVFGFGKLAFYGRQNAEERGETRFYERAHGSEVAQNDPFALDLDSDPVRRGLYLEAEADDGYLRDRSVFSDGISIEDDMALVVRYSTGATLTYHLTAYSPWEGYRVAFNGDRGRLELEVVERSHVSASGDGEGARETGERLVLQPLWGKAREVPIEGATGDGHGGADSRLLAALFGGDDVNDPLERSSSHVDGVLAILPGIGANLSFAGGRPVDLTTLVRM